MAELPVVLGVDGGGSKTEGWAVTRSGQLVAAARMAGVDATALGEDGLKERLRSLRMDLLSGPGPAGLVVQAVALGMPLYGEGVELSRRLEGICAEVFPEPRYVTNDARVGLEAALGGAPGIALEAGTGAMAWGKTADGCEGRCGGWSEAFSDEGSSYWIGIEALRRASQMWDGRIPRTPLMEAVLEETQSRDFGEVARWSAEDRRRRIASLAAAVDVAARQGDPWARHILNRSGIELARMALALRDQLFPDEKPLVARYGSVFRSAIVVAATDSVLRRAGLSDTVPALLKPVAGACLLAADVAGWQRSAIMPGLERATQGK